MNEEFKEITAQEIINILEHTIKHDDTNKLITFLALLSTYTEEDQLNLCFNAPSSSGKTFIAMQVAELFPKEDVIKLGGCSPKAFFHEQGVVDPAKGHIVDLSRKILIFMDQPDFTLLSVLRPMLSHDQKEIVYKITDKSKGSANRTKNVILRGYPTVVFCSASSKMDEQESTRAILLSPEISSEKISKTLEAKVEKDSDKEAYIQRINSIDDRNLLKQRIELIRNEKISSIIIDHPSEILKGFRLTSGELAPRHQRDIGRLSSLIKMFALINLWNRERRGSSIVATMEDIKSGLELWLSIAKSHCLGIPPYIVKLFEEIVMTPFLNKNIIQVNFGMDRSLLKGISRSEIMQAHLAAFGTELPGWKLNQHYLPQMEAAKLISIHKSDSDKRITLVWPTKYKP